MMGQVGRGLNRIIAGDQMMASNIDSYQANRQIDAYDPTRQTNTALQAGNMGSPIGG